MSDPERLCITDPRRVRSPRVLLLRVEVWLCRWWGEARAQGRNAEAAEIWSAAQAVSPVAAQVAPPRYPSGIPATAGR